MNKPILYLDVDGVLWDLPKTDGIIYSGNPIGAKGLQEFLDFAFKNFEIRWCTTWAPSGKIHPIDCKRLEKHTGINEMVWRRINKSNGWIDYKYENIDYNLHKNGRLFVWVEDDLLPEELRWLKDNNWEDRYFYTDIFEDSDALIKTTEKLKNWLKKQCFGNMKKLLELIHRGNVHYLIQK